MNLSSFKNVGRKAEYATFGFIRHHSNISLLEYDIPEVIMQICTIFYYDNRQVSILQNEQLRALSVKLVTSDGNEFIRFMTKFLRTQRCQQLWDKIDTKGKGKIDTKQFEHFWTQPTVFFKVSMYQRRTRTENTPKWRDMKNVKKEHKHLAMWIIRKYGERQSDETYSFTLKHKNFANVIVGYLYKYAKVKGELKIPIITEFDDLELD